MVITAKILKIKTIPQVLAREINLKFFLFLLVWEYFIISYIFNDKIGNTQGIKFKNTPAKNDKIRLFIVFFI